MSYNPYAPYEDFKESKPKSVKDDEVVNEAKAEDDSKNEELIPGTGIEAEESDAAPEEEAPAEEEKPKKATAKKTSDKKASSKKG